MPETQEVTETPTIESTMGEVFDKMNEPEVKEPEAPVEAAEVTSEEETPITDQTPSETPEETETPSIPRPQSWSADVDELWNKLPPESQEFIAKRESESHKKITALGEQAAIAEQYKEIIEKFPGLVGQAPEKEIENLLATKAALLRDPVNSIRWLAQQLNVDLSQIYPQPQSGMDTPEAAQIQALTQHIANLEQRLSETSNRISSREQAELQAREDSLAQSIEKYAEGKDYWDDNFDNEVMTQIIALKQSDPKRALADPMAIVKEAEERATRIIPAVYEKLQEAKQKEAEAKKLAEDKRKADEAKKLASMNVKSTGGSSPKASAKSIEAEMEEVYNRLQATG